MECCCKLRSKLLHANTIILRPELQLLMGCIQLALMICHSRFQVTYFQSGVSQYLFEGGDLVPREVGDGFRRG